MATPSSPVRNDCPAKRSVAFTGSPESARATVTFACRPATSVETFVATRRPTTASKAVTFTSRRSLADHVTVVSAGTPPTAKRTVLPSSALVPSTTSLSS